MQTNELTALLAAIILTRVETSKGAGIEELAAYVKTAVAVANAVIKAAQQGR